MLGLPMMKLPPWFGGQMGVPGSDTPEGLRLDAGRVLYVATATVNSESDDNNDGTDPRYPKATIQGAIDNARAGDWIVLQAGSQFTLTAALDLDVDDVKLLSLDYLNGFASRVTIDSDGSVNLLDVSASRVEIAGIRFDNSAANTNDCLTFAESSDETGLYVHDCEFLAGLNGVVLGEASEPYTATDVLIQDNVIWIVDDTAANNQGISIVRAMRTVIRHNTIGSNGANAHRGVACANVSTPMVIIVENDFVFNQAGVGIYRAGTTVNVSMHRNLFSGTMTAITVNADGGNHAVENYEATGGAGGAIVDATT